MSDIAIRGEGLSKQYRIGKRESSNALPDVITDAAATYNDAEPVNIGTGSEIKISELVNLIAKLTGFTGEIRWQTDKPDGQPRRSLDVSRAQEKFGFKASTPFELGLARTIEWYEVSDRLQKVG